jgi:lantibiotic modifying enzyme
MDMSQSLHKLTDVCEVIAERLKDSQWVKEVSLKEQNFMPYIQAYPWGASSLSHGYPGLIILFSEMDAFFPHQEWEYTAHQYIVDLLQEIEQTGVHNSSLFSGLTGICFAIHLASKQGTRYQTVLAKLNSILMKQIKTDYLVSLYDAKFNAEPFSPLQYDVIVGLSGVLSYLLEYSHVDAMRETARSVVEALVLLKDSVSYEGHQLPGWYTLCHHLIHEEQRLKYPQGCFDTGLAHGIAGCLAALSKAYLNGILVDDQLEMIQHLSTWLLEHPLDKERYLWPSKYAFNPHCQHQLEVKEEFYRDGWCYGAPGIASALFLAGKTLVNQRLQQEAIQVMTNVCERFQANRNLECVSFCHGLAGLLTMLHSMYLETQIEKFARTSQQIVDLILERYDASLPFGFKCFASIPNTDETRLVDNAGFLDGVVGTILSLLFSISNKQREWTQIFLIN